jgi:L-aminopeptidase/D-esterase-like protein
MQKTGPRNLITDIDGISIGNAHDRASRTGVTVILCEQPAVASCSVPGGGPGTRETDALQPANLVDKVDAIVLAGGSVYGLDAASAVTKELGLDGRGFVTGAELASPIVPSAILYDLKNGGDVKDSRAHIYSPLGKAALRACSQEFELGNQGAGFGAIAGTIKGGLGSCSAILDDLPAIGAIIAANPFGASVDANSRLWAQDMAQLGPDGQLEFGTMDLKNAPALPHKHPFGGTKANNAFPGTNTTIGVIATDADLTPAEAQRVAIMAQDGLARAIRPIHTPFDGDCLFVLATGKTPLSQTPDQRALKLALLGEIAANSVSRAVGRAIWSAETIGDIPSIHQL